MLLVLVVVVVTFVVVVVIIIILVVAFIIMLLLVVITMVVLVVVAASAVIVMCQGSECMHVCVQKCVRVCVRACIPVSVILRHPARVPLTGAHINPAVTVALVVVGRFPLRKVPHYLLGQYAGGFLAAAVVYCVYLGKTPSESLRVIAAAILGKPPSQSARVLAAAILRDDYFSIVTTCRDLYVSRNWWLLCLFYTVV